MTMSSIGLPNQAFKPLVSGFLAVPSLREQLQVHNEATVNTASEINFSSVTPATNRAADIEKVFLETDGKTTFKIKLGENVIYSRTLDGTAAPVQEIVDLGTFEVNPGETFLITATSPDATTTPVNISTTILGSTKLKKFELFV